MHADDRSSGEVTLNADLDEVRAHYQDQGDQYVEVGRMQEMRLGSRPEDQNELENDE
jgi:hypothetical protein